MAQKQKGKKNEVTRSFKNQELDTILFEKWRLVDHLTANICQKNYLPILKLFSLSTISGISGREGSKEWLLKMFSLSKFQIMGVQQRQEGWFELLKK